LPQQSDADSINTGRKPSVYASLRSAGETLTLLASRAFRPAFPQRHVPLGSGKHVPSAP